MPRLTSAATAACGTWSVLEASLDPAMHVSPDGSVDYANQAMVQLTGFGLEHLLGRPVWSHVTEPPLVLAALEKAHEVGTARCDPLALRHPDGSSTDVLFNVAAQRAEDGSPSGFLCVARDLGFQNPTDEVHRLVIEAAPDAILLVDQRGRIEFVNAQTESLFGYRRDELIGRPVDSLLPLSAQERHAQLREDYWQDPVPRPMGVGHELMARRRDGSEFHVEVSLGPVKTPQGMVVCAAVRDVTSQVGVRAEALRANRAKTVFLSRVSHELRTPLNAILGFGQLLEAQLKGAAERDDLDRLMSAGRQLSVLVDDILDVTQGDSGRIGVTVEPVGLLEAVEKAVASVESLAQLGRVSILLDRDMLDASVRADRRRLPQVVTHLLENAVKFSDEGGEVRITLERPSPGRVRLLVSDTGHGISEEDLPILFEPFGRMVPAHPGTGLGLAVARALAVAMDGEVGVSSTEGLGSKFWVDLKTSLDPPHAPSSVSTTPADPQSASRQAQLLYVEDNISNVRLLERIIARRPDVRLVVSPDGGRAVDLALQTAPDLILLDLNLPDIPGEEVLRQLRAHPKTAETPVVILSADAMPGRPEQLINLGACGYLTKPFDISGLLALIDSILAAPGPAGQLAGDHGPGTTSAPAAASSREQGGAAELLHDLNNELGAILNYCALLAQRVEGTAAAPDLDEVRRAARSAADLVIDLRHLDVATDPAPQLGA